LMRRDMHLHHLLLECNTLGNPATYCNPLCNAIQQTASHSATQGFRRSQSVGKEEEENEEEAEKEKGERETWGGVYSEARSVSARVRAMVYGEEMEEEEEGGGVVASASSKAARPASGCTSALGHVVDHMSERERDTATHCNRLQHAATHCDTLQHTATHSVCMSALVHAFDRVSPHL